MLVYPAIDLKGGACVRLLQGRPDTVERYDVDASDLLASAQAAGARQVHLVDVDGAEAGEPRQYDLITALARQVGLDLQVGGGLRTAADVARVLEAGATRAVIGTASIERAEAVSDWIAVFGKEQIAASLDVREAGGELRVGSLSRDIAGGPTLWAALESLRFAGLKHVVLTDRDREGELTGPNLALVQEVTRRRPDLNVQYGGGVRSAEDVAALKRAGAAGVVIGRAFLDGSLPLRDAIRAG